MICKYIHLEKIRLKLNLLAYFSFWNPQKMLPLLALLSLPLSQDCFKKSKLIRWPYVSIHWVSDNVGFYNPLHRYPNFYFLDFSSSISTLQAGTNYLGKKISSLTSYPKNSFQAWKVISFILLRVHYSSCHSTSAIYKYYLYRPTLEFSEFELVL